MQTSCGKATNKQASKQSKKPTISIRNKTHCCNKLPACSEINMFGICIAKY